MTARKLITWGELKARVEAEEGVTDGTLVFQMTFYGASIDEIEVSLDGDGDLLVDDHQHWRPASPVDVRVGIAP